MKTIKPISLILLSIFIFQSCHQPDRLIGKWERISDRHKGMQILVKNEGVSFKAEIIATTDSNVLSGFVVGDIKWKDIKKISENKYEFQDLGKISIIFSDKFGSEYVMARLEIITDTLLQTRLFAKANEVTGTESKWKKIKDTK
jgi:hypothetical protein